MAISPTEMLEHEHRFIQKLAAAATLADRLAEDQASLRQEFEKVEKRLQQGTHHRLEDLAENLAPKIQGV